MKKTKRGPGRPKKQKPITLECELNTGETLSLTAVNRRNLNTMLFEDTRGRMRVSYEGEPLLSNLNGPAITYPDGEEEFYINGRVVSIASMPGACDYVSYDAFVTWEGEGLGRPDADIGECDATLACEDDQHGWFLTFRRDGDGADIELLVDASDLYTNSPLVHNHLGLEPHEYFHTMEFAHKLLDTLTEWVPNEEAYGQFFTEEAAKEFAQIMDRQLRGLPAFEEVKSKHKHDHTHEEARPVLMKYRSDGASKVVAQTGGDRKDEAKEEPKEGSGLGKVMVAGMVAAATAGAIGMLSKGAVKAVPQKVQVSA